MNLSTLLPGFSLCLLTGLVAIFLSAHYGAPAMLFALLLGIAMSFLYEQSVCREGIAFCASFILKFGIALLGFRIVLSDLVTLGWESIVILTCAICSTVLIGVYTARFFGLRKSFGALTAGSVSICGASAALAISTILPDYKDKERDTLLTVICVTSMSTLAMILYPIIVSKIGLQPTEAGLFLGATIHDVAQVVGAGYSVSSEVGDTATLVKLVRVSMLLPVVVIMLLVLAWQARQNRNLKAASAVKSVGVPFFLIAFFLLVGLNSSMELAPKTSDLIGDFARTMLVAAIAAIGMKSNLAKLSSVGWKPVFLMLIETSWLAIFVILSIILL